MQLSSTKSILILDLDGVLITTPPWKSDEIASDGYSKFNDSCVVNLNSLLTIKTFEIWLSSTRRTTQTLETFNQIFKHRNITEPITGYVPEYPDCQSRKEEIVKFINDKQIEDFLIIDDDKSLNDLELSLKKNLVSTDLLKGFDTHQLKVAIDICQIVKS